MNASVAKAMRYLRPVLLAAAMLLLAGMVLQFGFRNLLELAIGLSPLWVGAALLTIVANFAFAARRYQVLAAPQLPFAKVLDTIMVSFLLNYASMVQGLGIGAKVGLLKAEGVVASRSIAGIFSEIAFDLLFAVAVGAVFWATTDDLPGLLRDMPTVFTATLSVLLGMSAVAAFLALRFSRFLHDVTAHMADIARSGKLLGVLAATAGIWFAGGLGFYCMLHAVEGASPATLFLCVVAITTGFVTGLISMIPGGIGVREVTWAYVASLSGVSIGVAGIVAVLYRILSIAVIIVVLLAWRRFARTDVTGRA